MKFTRRLKRAMLKSVIRRRNAVLNEFAGQYQISRHRLDHLGNYRTLDQVNDIRWSHELHVGSVIYRFIGMTSKEEFKRLDNAVFKALFFRPTPVRFTSAKMTKCVETDHAGNSVTFINPNF